MSKQFYWGVISYRKNEKYTRIWPQRFHFRAHDAKNEAWRWNKMEESHKNPRKYIVQRFIFEHKKEIYYDVYTHEVKRL